MRNYFQIFFTVLLLLVIFSGCEDNTPTDPPEQNYPDYYPGGIGSTLKYSVTEKDSTGNIVQEGTRNILYSGTFNFRGRDYITQEDSLDFGNQSSVNTFL
ncbi:MAG: hypothetical protein OQK57_03860, partial [Ignavibacteriaceae bacterium]|nr:hypothetical protein [Ignavibacteriaceae bacterium]